MSNKIAVRAGKRQFYFAFACLLLTACGSLHKTAPGWAAPVKVPTELANPVPEPILADEPDNGDLARFADELRAALRAANARLRRIREL